MGLTCRGSCGNNAQPPCARPVFPVADRWLVVAAALLASMGGAPRRRLPLSESI